MEFLFIKSFIPEFFLSFCILLQLVINAFFVTKIAGNQYFHVSIEAFYQVLFILICLFILVLNSKIEGSLFNHLFLNDQGTYQIKCLLIFITIITLYSLIESFLLESLSAFEYFTLFLLSLLSLLLLISANDFLAIYLTIEMQALIFYTLAGFKKDSANSIESGLKYYIMGSFFSGIFIFGCAIIYSILGTLNFSNLILLLLSLNYDDYNIAKYIVFLGLLCILSTLLFKLGAAPFHYLIPDIYEGAPLASTIIFSILPKLSIFYIFFKIVFIISLSFNLINITIGFFGIISLLIGTLFGLHQKKLKRLIIYASIAQVGFILSAFFSITFSGMSLIIFYILIYLLTSTVLWLTIAIIYSFKKKVADFYNNKLSTLYITDLAGLYQVNPAWCILFIIIFFSTIGLPPFVGFLSKMFILYTFISTKNFLFAILLILINLIGTYYYLNIIKIVLFEPISKKNIKLSTIFYTKLFYINTIIISWVLFLHLFLFFDPSFPLIICYSILVNTNFLI